MVVVNDATNDSGKELKENWPITEGLVLGTTKIDGRQTNLVPEGLQYKDINIKSIVPSRNKELI